MAETAQQDRVLRRHNANTERLGEFFSSLGPSTPQSEPVNNDSLCCYNVSTTRNSTVALVSIGLKSVFTRNTYAADDANRWLIRSRVKELPRLANFIREKWNEMLAEAPLDDQSKINDIAPHVLFDATDTAREPVIINLACDGDNVRATIADINVWSHPPRNQALMSTIRNNAPCLQMLGRVKKSAKQWRNALDDENIPREMKAQRREERRVKTKSMFLKFYKEFANILSPKKLPNSFKWPTIQLSQNGRRYGGTFAGAHGPRANEVHNIFPARNVQSRDSMKDVFLALVGEGFDDIMADDRPST